MADLRSLVIKNGTTQQISNADTLIVGTTLDAASGQTLTIGGTNATGITIGGALITTNFPGPVTLTGDVTTVGGTTFTTDATFEGDVTFGNANTDTVSFISKVDSDILFTGDGVTPPAYNIQNVKDPVNPQDVATKAYVDAASGAATLQTAYQNGNTITTAAGDGAVIIAGDQNFTFTSSGNFGIGSASPTDKLTVVGNVNQTLGTVSLSANGASSFTTSAGALTLTSAAAATWSTTAGNLVLSGAANLELAAGVGSEVVVNQAAANVDFRVKGDTDVNLIFADASADRVAIGVAAPNAKLTVGGAVSVIEQGSTPSTTSGFGKLYAKDGVNNARPYWLDDTGQSYNLTLDRFNSLASGGAITIDTSPALPIFNSVTLNANATFSTTNLGDGRSASVRIVCDGTTRTLTWPAGWTWLGSGAPTSLAANDIGYVAITAYGATDADVVAAWSYENAATAVTGSGADNQISVWSGTYTQDGSASFTFDGTTFSSDSAVTFNDSGSSVDFRVEGDTDQNLLFVDGSADFVGIGTASPSAKLTVSGGITQSSGAVSLSANAASSFTTSSGALTLTAAAASTWSTSAGALTITSAAAATWSTAAGTLALSGAADLELAAGAGSEVVVNQAGADVDFRVEGDTDTHALFVQGSDNHVGIGTSNVSTHLFNIGSGAASNFAVASGGKIHTYGGAAPLDGQLLIGNTAQGRFDAASLTAGSGVTITPGAGSITIAATGTGGTVTSIDVSGGTTGLTFSGGPVTTSGTITMAGTLGVTNGGTGTTTQFTQGSVVFAGASGIYAQDNANLFWDNTNDRLGIGTATPSTALSVFEKFKVDSGGYITGYDNAAITDGEILIGDTGDGRFEKATITSGTGISITNGAGAITLAATGTVPLITTGLTAGDVCYASANSTGSAAIATAAATSRVLGFVSTVGASGTIQVTGIYIGANFITGLTGLAAGQPVYLSKTSGKLTNDVSAFVSGDVVAEIGIAVNVSSGTGGAAAADVLVQPKSIVVL